MPTEVNSKDILAQMDEDALRRALDITVRPILDEFVKRGFIVLITGDPLDANGQGKPDIHISITQDHPRSLS